MSEKTKINTRKAILIRSNLIFLGVAIIGVYLLVSIFKLQNGFDKEYSTDLKNKNTRITNVEGIRGNIYAGDGSLLATSVPTYDLIWDANVEALTDKEFKSAIDSLAMLFGRNFPQKSEREWRQKFNTLRVSKNHYYKVVADLNFDKVKAMKKWPLLRKSKFKGGFWFIEKGRRMYFMGELARRAIGYTKNGVSIGLEGAFDSLLRGKSTQIMEQRMPGNIWRPVRVGEGETAENGKDIVTTLDVDFQDITQFALNNALIQYQADHGCAIVMEVNTGAIKAIANLKRSADGLYYEKMNYAVDQFSEPGSTFKLISVMALLEDKKALPTDSVPTKRGRIKYYDKEFTDGAEHGEPPAFYTLQESFEISSNVGISQFVFNAYKENPKKFVNHVLDLGLNIKPNFDIPSSNKPVILDPSSSGWSGVALPSMSIGYSSKISPLQTLMVYNAIANKGKMMKPYMVKEIRQDGQTLEVIKPQVLKDEICSNKTLGQLQEMLKGVVSRGTAEQAFDGCPYTVAGKTGTARISNEGQRGYSNKHMASFVGYFPAENPQYSIIVVINEPKGAIYGGVVAAPVFREIANKIYSSHIRLQPEAIKPFETKSVPKVANGEIQSTKYILNELGISSQTEGGQTSGYVKASSKTKNIEFNPLNIKAGVVPDFRGMGIRDAQYLAGQLNIRISFTGFGRVSKQNITPGTRFSQSINVNLELKP